MVTHNTLEHFISAMEYNDLPHIDNMRDVAEHHTVALQALLSLIRQYELQEKLSVHLLHEHFDAPEGAIMVYETKTSAKYPAFMIFGPRKIQNASAVRGLYFQARSGGQMRAYEYTADEGDHADVHADFMTVFSNLCFELGVQDVFALTVRRPLGTVFTEIECPKFGPQSCFQSPPGPLLSRDISQTITDWISPADVLISGIIELKCTKMRNSHFNFTCSKTRSGKHYEQKSGLTCSATGSGKHHEQKSGFMCVKTRSGKHYEQKYEFDGDESYELGGKIYLPETDVVKVLNAAYGILAVC